MDYSELRRRMVEEQLISRGFRNPRILEAFRRVPREEFVPAYAKPSAYVDAPLSIGHSQTISQPYTVAFMTQLLEPEPTDKVLEVGTGSGYQAAILAELVSKVFSIEYVEGLAIEAKQTLKRLGYENVEVLVGDGSKGLPDDAPFDGIIVTAACPEVPKPLLEQLAEGGRLIAPVGGPFLQEMVRITKTKEGELERETSGAFRFVPLVKRE